MSKRQRTRGELAHDCLLAAVILFAMTEVIIIWTRMKMITSWFSESESEKLFPFQHVITCHKLSFECSLRRHDINHTM